MMFDFISVLVSCGVVVAVVHIAAVLFIHVSMTTIIVLCCVVVIGYVVVAVDTTVALVIAFLTDVVVIIDGLT